MKVSEKLCRTIIQGLLKRHEDSFSSWHEFVILRKNGVIPDFDEPNSPNQQQLLRAVAFGKKQGWIKAYWMGVGLTPYAGSARRSREYQITEKGRKLIS